MGLQCSCRMCDKSFLSVHLVQAGHVSLMDDWGICFSILILKKGKFLITTLLESEVNFGIGRRNDMIHIDENTQ